MSEYQFNLSDNFINSAVFTDVDEVVEKLNIYREININMLTFEPFKVEITQIDFGKVLLFFANLSCPLHLIGSRRSDFIHFDIYLTLEGVAVEHGNVININTLNSFSPDHHANSIIPKNSVICDVQIEKNLFMATCQSMRREDLLKNNFLHKDFIDLPNNISEYRNYLKELFYLFKTESSLFKNSDYCQIILGDLLPILIDVIPRQNSSLITNMSLSQRSKLVNKATDFINANLNKPLTLKDIYTHLGISRRTLFYSFKSIFGTTPLGYIKAQRLQGARRSLKHAKPQTRLVMNIAHQWGYWNLSRFAQDYQLMFGELPSETLKN